MILDLRMPGIDGIGVLEHLDPEDHWLPTIMASAHMDDSIVRNAISLGVVDFLSKPVRPNDLRRIAQYVLDEESQFQAVETEAPSPEHILPRARGLLRRRRLDEAVALLHGAPPEVPGRDAWIRIAESARPPSPDVGRCPDRQVSLREVLTNHPIHHES
jgi:YesN/AraC family two-component response regulator